jgi:hypothetical protein
MQPGLRQERKSVLPPDERELSQTVAVGIAAGETRRRLGPMKHLALIGLCLLAFTTLTACSGDYYYAMTYPGSQLDPGTQ